MSILDATKNLFYQLIIPIKTFKVTLIPALILIQIALPSLVLVLIGLKFKLNSEDKFLRILPKTNFIFNLDNQ